MLEAVGKLSTMQDYRQDVQDLAREVTRLTVLIDNVFVPKEDLDKELETLRKENTALYKEKLRGERVLLVSIIAVLLVVVLSISTIGYFVYDRGETINHIIQRIAALEDKNGVD